MKKCPFCAESIQDEALKCRYCGEFLDGRTPSGSQPSMPAPDDKPREWMFRPTALVVSFCMVGPLMLPLIWFHPAYSRLTKLLITAVVLTISYVLYQWLMTSLAHLQEYLSLMQGMY